MLSSHHIVCKVSVVGDGLSLNGDDADGEVIEMGALLRQLSSLGGEPIESVQMALWLAVKLCI